MLIPFVLLLAAAAPQTADPTLPPPGATAVLTAQGKGVQIYTCSAKDTAFQWTFKAPEAQLLDQTTGKSIGKHDAGPTWTLDDGSSIKGTVLQKRPGDRPSDVPWLLLKALSIGTGQGTSRKRRLCAPLGDAWRQPKPQWLR